jgi:hypothetical protein
MKTILLSALLLALAGCSAMPNTPQTTAPNTDSTSNTATSGPGTPSPSSSSTSSPAPGSNIAPLTPPDSSVDAGVGGATDAPPLPEGSNAVDLSNISQVVVGIGNRFFSARGESRPLQVQLKDARGQVIAPAGVTYSYVSSRPQDFSVDATGQVVAQVSEGFSSITVRLNGSDKQATQLVSVSNAASGGGGGGSNASSAPTEEKVNGQVEFQF